MKGYSYLVISVVAEVFGTAMLNLTEGFTVFLPSLGVIIGYGIAFYYLSLCLKTISLSLAYAIWSGSGTALTALIGNILGRSIRYAENNWDTTNYRWNRCTKCKRQ